MYDSDPKGINAQASAWMAVCDALHKHNPKFLRREGLTGRECALDEIRRLQALDTTNPRGTLCQRVKNLFGRS